LDLFCFAWASSQIKKRTMMKTFTLACVVLLLTHGGNAQCVTEDTALDVCMETAGLGDAAKEACDICVSAAAAATYAIRNTTCDDLAMADNGLCIALGLCPTCPVGCSAEMEAYALCEVNDELGLGCQTLECNFADPETPTTAPAPTEAGSTPTEAAPTEAGSAPTSVGIDACLTEDTALDVCMEKAGLGDAAKEACDICVSAAAAAMYASRNTTCDELAMADNGLCVALGLCPTCPVGSCSAEMEAYALCEVNDELGLGCQTLECNAADPETPTMAPAPTEAGSTPTEAAPTEAGSTPTEAPPTDTPTSMASPTYTKIGAFVAGLLAITALI
jgi:hypothetical protein